MKFAWVGFEREISPSIIIEVLKQKINLLYCYEYEFSRLPEFLDIYKLSNVDEDPSIVFYEISKNESEFPVIWEFLSFLDLLCTIKNELAIAYHLSEALNCKIVTDGSGLGIDSSEYWDVVFDKGKVFLVDDIETKFAGDGNGLLKYVKELNLQSIIKI